jgi:hypothetical protein
MDGAHFFCDLCIDRVAFKLFTKAFVMLHIGPFRSRASFEFCGRHGDAIFMSPLGSKLGCRPNATLHNLRALSIPSFQYR